MPQHRGIADLASAAWFKSPVSKRRSPRPWHRNPQANLGSYPCRNNGPSRTAALQEQSNSLETAYGIPGFCVGRPDAHTCPEFSKLNDEPSPDVATRAQRQQLGLQRSQTKACFVYGGGHRTRARGRAAVPPDMAAHVHVTNKRTSDSSPRAKVIAPEGRVRVALRSSWLGSGVATLAQ